VPVDAFAVLKDVCQGPAVSIRHSTERADPDPRLLQANERTLLAWIRTGIALITFGFVIARIDVWLRALSARDSGFRAQSFGSAWIGAVFVALGVLANGVATRRYAQMRRAIRERREIPDDRIPVLFASIVTVLGALIGAYVVRRLI
jgi:putative membrane protein